MVTCWIWCHSHYKNFGTFLTITSKLKFNNLSSIQNRGKLVNYSNHLCQKRFYSTQIILQCCSKCSEINVLGKNAAVYLRKKTYMTSKNCINNFEQDVIDIAARLPFHTSDTTKDLRLWWVLVLLLLRKCQPCRAHIIIIERRTTGISHFI